MGPEASAAFKLAAKAGVMHAMEPVGVLAPLDGAPVVQGGREDRDGVDGTVPGLDGALSTASAGGWYERSQPRALAEPRPARFVHACDDVLCVTDVTCSEAGRSALASGSPFDAPPAGGDDLPGPESEAPLPALEFDAPEYVGHPLSLDDDWLSSLRSLSRLDSIFGTGKKQLVSIQSPLRPVSIDP